MVKSTGWSLCSGCVFSKWHLSLLDIKLSQPSALRLSTLQALLITHHCTGEAKSKLCVSYSLVFVTNVNCFGGTLGNVSSSVLCLHANIHHKLVHVMVVFLINSLSTASCTDSSPLTVWPGLFGDS